MYFEARNPDPTVGCADEIVVSMRLLVCGGVYKYGQ